MLRYMLLSDSHRAGGWLARAAEVYAQGGFNGVIHLGDVHSDAKRFAELAGVAPLCVRGNCEAEVDQMVLSFPVMADYAVIPMEGRVLYATHGHHACEDAPPPLCPGDILLCGHTHIPRCAEHEGFVYMNPGSISLPKAGSERSYMVYENGRFAWKRLEDGTVYQEYSI